MHYILLSQHSPEVCPLANARTRELLIGVGPEIPKIAETCGVTIVAGPYVSREHLVVSVVESAAMDNVDRFIKESRLEQWNRVRVIPSKPMAEGFEEVQAAETIF